MSEDYRPWIRKESRAEYLAEFDRAMGWLEDLVGRTAGGRFQTCRARLSKAFRLLLEDRPDQIPKKIPPAELAAFLRALGLVVRLDGLSDLTIEFQDVSALCECKRVQTPNALEPNLQEAGSQLGTALGQWKEPRRCRGIIGLNVSKNHSSRPCWRAPLFRNYLAAR